MLEVKHCNSVVDWTQLRRESLRWRMFSRNLQTEKQREQDRKNQNRISKDCGATPKEVRYMRWEYQRKKERNRSST